MRHDFSRQLCHRFSDQLVHFSSNRIRKRPGLCYIGLAGFNRATEHVLHALISPGDRADCLNRRINYTSRDLEIARCYDRRTDQDFRLSPRLPLGTALWFRSRSSPRPPAGSHRYRYRFPDESRHDLTPLDRRSMYASYSVSALLEQARSARLKLRASRRKARCFGSPTEVDDRSSSPSSSPLRPSRSLSLPPTLSLFSSLRYPPPSSLASLLIHLPICLSVYLRHRSLSLSHPHIATQLALSEHQHTTRISCGWMCRCAPPQR